MTLPHSSSSERSPQSSWELQYRFWSMQWPFLHLNFPTHPSIEIKKIITLKSILNELHTSKSGKVTFFTNALMQILPFAKK